MGFFDITPKKESTQICVEVFKGHLEKDAIVDYTKKEFTESATQPHKAIRVSKNI